MKHIKTFLLLTLLSFVGASCSDGERMRQRLAEMQACNQADTVFSARWIPTVDSLTDYFDNHGTPNERLLAHYLEGRVLSDIGEAPAALQAYYVAIDCTDTIQADCDYKILRGVYGQMSRIFHQQNLPYDEIDALQHYVDCIKRTSNTEEYIVAKSQLIRPYYLLGEKDAVLQIINDTYHSLKRIGKDQRAASILPTAIYIYIEHHDLGKAKEIMDIFECDSGLFDENGNIARGRESYYYTKGFYELAVNKVDSAEVYFRKAIQHGYLSDGYKGLLSVYKAKNNVDSVTRFANLYEAAQDTLHNKMQIDVIHQMSALYNYNRSQREAAQERAKAQETLILLGYIILIAIALFFIIIVISWQYRKTRKEKQRKINQLEESLSNAKQQRFSVQEELRKLKEKDYEGMIAEKEKQEAELTQTIEKLQAENERIKHKATDEGIDRLDDFLSSQIAQLFMKKANGKAERPIPSDAEWNLLMSEFCKYNPVTFKSFSEGKPLSPLEERICVLLILDIPEKTISIMTNSISTTVSNAKSRANRKLYGKKDAFLLKNNLIHTLRRS